EHGAGVAIEQRKDRVEMHRRPALREQATDDAGRRLVAEQLAGDLEYRLAGGALAHPDEDDAVADRHDVAALHGGPVEVLVGIAPPDLEIPVLEFRVKLVDRP